MPRHPDPVTVGVPIGAHLLRRLDTVASDLGLGRPEAIHAALLCWLEQEESKTAVRDRMRSARAKLALTTTYKHWNHENEN